MIHFKINKISYPFPTHWGDVTYRQSVALLDTSTLTDHISVFTNIPRETLKEAEIKNLERISLALSFLSITPKFERTRMVGPYVMPTDITIQSTGQFEDLRGLMMQLPKDGPIDPKKLSDLYLHACAIYCQKLRDGRYDPNKVAEVKEELKDYSCVEVMGTGAFFLFRPMTISRNTTTRYQRFTQRLKNLSQGLPGYQKTSALLQRLFGLAEK